MKLATFVSVSGAHHVGVVHSNDQLVFDLTEAGTRSDAPRRFESMLSLMGAGPDALDAARDLLRRYQGDPLLDRPLAGTALLAPVPVPLSVRDFVAFSGHILSAPVALRSLAKKLGYVHEGSPPMTPILEVPEVYKRQPAFYKGNRFTVIGSGADVRRPRDSAFLDYELEFGIFIGRHGTDVTRSSAREYIFGYSVFNDFSARDIQVREMGAITGPCKSKDFATGNAIGPWIVTADEIPDPYSLTMRSRVNGETWCTSSSANMIHSFEDMVAYVSRDEPLFPGEFFGSGTVGGGTGMEIDRFLYDGDVIELEVGGLGVLRNRIVPSLAA